MNIDTIRNLYKIGIIVALLLFLAMVIDHFANDAGVLVPLVIVFAIVALLMLVLLFVRPSDDASDASSEAEQEEARAAVLEDYPGDVHEVVDLEGIGPAYADKLHAAGIFHTQHLLFTPDEEVQAAVGVPGKTVRNWKSMAQLVKVNGIGPQYAEALTRGGIEGIEGLRDGDSAAMAEQVNEYLDGLKSTVVGQRISEKRVRTWQTAARKMKKTSIDVDAIKVRALESKAAQADARGAAPA